MEDWHKKPFFLLFFILNSYMKLINKKISNKKDITMIKEIQKLYTKGYSYKLDCETVFEKNIKCAKCGNQMKNYPIEDESGNIYCCRNCFCTPVKIRPIQYNS